MEGPQIFVVQVVFSFVVYGLIATWYVGPRLAPLPLPEVLRPLIFLHAFRYVGVVFLVPAVVAPTLVPEFARPAAYGNVLAAGLALGTLVALRGRWPLALPLVWLFNVVGTADLLYAFSQGWLRGVGPSLGSAWYIPTLIVDALRWTGPRADFAAWTGRLGAPALQERASMLAAARATVTR